MSAHAPYNFIPLNVDEDGNPQILRGHIVDHHHYDEDKNTGYFDVTLETKTPLFVRGMRGATMPDDTKISDPFMLNDKPVIPGSSLRGMIRALVEIITFGKMHFVDDRSLIYRSVGDKTNFGAYYRGHMTNELSDSTNDDMHFNYPSDSLKAGYLERVEKRNDKDSGWAIRPAQVDGNGFSFALVNRSAVKSAGISLAFYSVSNIVWVKPQSRTLYTKIINPYKKIHLEVPQTADIRKHNPHNPNYKPARIVLAGQTIGRERHWYTAVFDEDKKADLIHIPQSLWNMYQDDLAISRDDERRMRPVKEDEPLFYLMKGDDLYYFGSTMMFRIPYDQSIHDLMPELPIDKKESENDDKAQYVKLDYADAMFGYVSEENHQRNPVAYSGRVSFTSASLKDENDDWNTGETLTYILSTPKPTTFQHYLEQPDIIINNPDRKKLRHYGTRNARIRGHKLYWRKKATMADLRRKSVTPSSQTSSMKAIKPNIKFCFRVHFENLTDAELGALAWALSLDDTPEGKRHHMLGMAKPYGLGVVKLNPILYLSDRQARYRTLFDADGKWSEPKKPIEKDFIAEFKKKFKQPFDELPRIQALFDLLRYYEPHSDFEYMQLGDFRERRVLDTPENIAKGKSLAKGDDK